MKEKVRVAWWLEGCLGRLADGWMDGWPIGQMAEWADRLLDVQANVRLATWQTSKLAGRMDREMCRWADGQTGKLVKISLNSKSI
jgi:hypothetical protein